MDVQNDSQKFSRSPTVDDLVDLCKHLNDAGVRYIIIGGFALIHHGFVRGTGHIDLLVDPSQENMERIRQALLYLPDQAIREVNPSDIARYTVVRIADEIVIDLLEKACEVTYELAQSYVEYDVVNGVRIPYPQVPLLIQTKQGIRPRDQQDRAFLQQLLKHRKVKK